MLSPTPALESQSTPQEHEDSVIYKGLTKFCKVEYWNVHTDFKLIDDQAKEKIRKEYDLPEFVRPKDLHSATEISKEDKEETHEADNSIAIETGNFVHLFLSKKINSIFDPEFDLTSEINQFKEIYTSGSSVNMKIVELIFLKCVCASSIL